MTEKPYFKKREEELVTGLKKIYDEKQDSYAKKRFTVLYSIDENPFEWDLMDNQKDCLIVKGNGTAICDLLNELNNENEQLKKGIIDCLFKGESLQIFAEEMGLIE